MGHQNKRYTETFLKKHNLNFSLPESFICAECKLGKQTRLSFVPSRTVTSKIGELVHTDVCGPMEVQSIGGSRYFLLFKDDYSSYRVIYAMSHKSQVIGFIRDFCLKLKNETGANVCTLRSDNGTEYLSLEWKRFYRANGIRHECSVPYTPEQNGLAERELRTIVEMSRAMIHAKSLNVNLWAEAVNTATFILNATQINKAGKTPHEIWFGVGVDISKL